METPHYYDENWDLRDVADLRRDNWEKLGLIEEGVYSRIDRLRMGTYDEQRDGNLLEVLEEIERILR